RWLAYTLAPGNGSNIWIARFESGDKKSPPALGRPRPVTATYESVGHAAWSRDGQTLCFERRDPWLIAAIDADGGHTDTLTSSLGDSRTPSFLGNDAQIVFASTRLGPWRIWRMN